MKREQMILSKKGNVDRALKVRSDENQGGSKVVSIASSFFTV